MVGKHQIEITGNELASGLATADNLSDGMIGSGSQNINLLPAQGEVYATTSHAHSGLANALVASCPEWQLTTGAGTLGNRWLVDSAGKIYVDNLGTLTNVLNSGVSLGTLNGVTDMVSFVPGITTDAAAFVTTGTNIMRITDGSNVGPYAVDASYWTSAGQAALSSIAPHPMIVFEGFLWIADRQKLHRIDTAGSISNAKLTLDPGDTILALGIDPGTGLMMISIKTTNGQGHAVQFPGRYYILLFDGFSPKVRRKIVMPGQVTAFITVGGRVYVGIDNAIGIWNGNGVDYVRRLQTSTAVYKQQLAAINNQLYVADGTTVFCLAEVRNGGPRVWFPIYYSANTINAIYQEDYNILVINNDTANVVFVDTTALNGIGTGTFYTNDLNFPRPVFIRKIRVFTSGISTTAGIGSLAVIDENATTNSLTSPNNKFVVASGTKYVFDFNYDLKLQTAQLKIGLDTQAFSIRKVIIYYDIAE